MAFENGRYYCDRCGKKIIQGQDLCKRCNEWLEEYIKAKQKDDVYKRFVEPYQKEQTDV